MVPEVPELVPGAAGQVLDHLEQLGGHWANQECLLVPFAGLEKRGPELENR